MSPVESGEREAAPKPMTFDLRAVVIAVLASLAGGGGLGSALSSHASDPLVEHQLKEINAKVDHLTRKVEASTSDRWTATQHATWADRHEVKVDRRLTALEERVSAHETLPWHREAGAEHSETKRRVDRLERDVQALKEQRK